MLNGYGYIFLFRAIRPNFGGEVLWPMTVLMGPTLAPVTNERDLFVFRVFIHINNIDVNQGFLCCFSGTIDLLSIAARTIPYISIYMYGLGV